MKYSIVCLISLVIMAGCGGTKEAFDNAKTTMSQGNEAPIRIEIPAVSKDFVMKEWESLMKNYKASVYQKDNDLYVDNAYISSIKDGTLDILTTFREREDEVVMTALIDLGGALLSPEQHPEQYQSAENLLKNFRKNTALKFLKSKKKAASKELQSLKDEKKDLESKNNQLQKTIDENKEEIKDLNKEIGSSENYNQEIDELIKLLERE